VLIALMAVHMQTEARLVKFQRTLKSITAQCAMEVDLVVAVSWDAVGPDLSQGVQQALRDAVEGKPTVDGDRAIPIISVQQQHRLSQFQHFQEALRVAEVHLAGRGGEGAHWVIFSDDDDIWHERRVAEFARAIRSHPFLEGVASFATTTRANVRAPERSGETPVPEDELPRNAEDVEVFLNSGRGVRHEDLKTCREWAELRATGPDGLLVPWDLDLECFDFCPRMRILREFFASTSETVLQHRFCDLRLCEFLQTYQCFGQELGLELAFFEPDCWMYFYAHAGRELDEFEKSIENPQESDKAEVGNLNSEHASAEVPVTQAILNLATEVLHEFHAQDQGVTLARLVRYLAAFQSNFEIEAVRRHSRKVDQRTFDSLVFCSARHSFGSFIEHTRKNSTGLMMLLSVCQGLAETIAQDVGVSVLWHQPGVFIKPDLVEVDEEGNTLTFA